MLTYSEQIIKQAFMEYDRRDTEKIINSYHNQENILPQVSRKTNAIITRYAKHIGNEKYLSSKRASYGTRKTLRVALLVAIVTALLAVSIYAIGKYTSAFESLNIRIFDKGSEVTFSDNDREGFLKVRYSYIPEGYELAEITEDDLSSYVVFLNEEGYKIVSLTSKNKDAISVYNTEGTQMIETTINGYPAIYIEMNNGYVLMWTMGEYHTSLLSDQVAIDELKLMAVSKHKKHFWQK